MRSLEAIEGQIGETIERDREILIRLSLPEAESVMAFLTDTLISRNGGVTDVTPQVKLEFRSDKLVCFEANVSMIFPFKTKVWARGYIADSDGRPRLLNNKVDIIVENKLARFAMIPFGLDKLVKQMLNNIPFEISQTLPERLAAQGYKARIGNIEIFFEKGEFVAKIQGAVTKVQDPS